jgi:hypothetical protein
MAVTPEVVESRNRNVQVVMVALALVAVVAVVWFVFLSGDEAEPTQSVVPPPAASDDSSGPERKVTRPSRGPVERFDVFAPKDPFDPLVSEGGGSGSGTTGGAPAGGTNTGGAAGGPAPTNPGESVGGHTVRLVDVFTQNGRARAQVQVDGTVYTVDEGETFAESFKLMSISGECATMLFGDDQFTICEGEELLK